MFRLAQLAKAGMPCSSGAGGVGSIPANSDAQNVPSFRPWRFEMKLGPFLTTESRGTACLRVALGECGHETRARDHRVTSDCVTTRRWRDENTVCWQVHVSVTPSQSRVTGYRTLLVTHLRHEVPRRRPLLRPRPRTRPRTSPPVPVPRTGRDRHGIRSRPETYSV